MDNELLGKEIVRIQYQLMEMDPTSEEYKKLFNELMLLDRSALESDKIRADIYRADTDRYKVRSEERREYVKIGSGILGGGLLITLVQLLESEKIIRSKAWQFATKMVNKIF